MSRSLDPDGPQARARRPRRSRADASQALIEAAATLFAERSSGRVTVREIAERADVNHALVHRYFGTKQNLMRAAFEQSQRAIAASLDDVTELRRDIDVVFRSILREKEFVAALARASLDGVLPDFPAGYPTMEGLLRRIEKTRGDRSTTRADPRVVVLCLGSLTLGYDLFGEFIRRGTRLDDMPEEDLEEAIIDVARFILDLALE